ncbi:MAG: hypothetical protein G01um101418_246 [Parcubacteria group bacterium Gr01-1014_18]|nr:MAG: hypothetical protein Greene041636_213 [Parcubacteria group bacterium Greene0416_36]TSC81264.1 MAG: hypothetical protein G01um101418_246 [Parcubacteria group bacterium Gr01-1014_18]TSC99286.1 MAG: hypothetical protein Greene101420_214 [Parcubacteria group bacterium Greene1014_20]TSD06877.1 MAG: hypothetical protein Greene07142_611 [Parcubacteria group bacterium Greene0714_2]
MPSKDRPAQRPIKRDDFKIKKFIKNKCHSVATYPTEDESPRDKPEGFAREELFLLVIAR